ncbi:MAG TPA: CBS domain-containing protein [Streptosporangiaceae bacterium]
MSKTVAIVAGAMVTIPVRHPESATVRDIRQFFADEHVHAALITNPAGRLESVVERGDLPPSSAPDDFAAPLGRLTGRTVPARADLAEAQRAMVAAGRRRAAVVDSDGRLVGLLCLKASGRGFCSDEDVLARRAQPR